MSGGGRGWVGGSHLADVEIGGQREVLSDDVSVHQMDRGEDRRTLRKGKRKKEDV